MYNVHPIVWNPSETLLNPRRINWGPFATGRHRGSMHFTQLLRLKIHPLFFMSTACPFLLCIPPSSAYCNTILCSSYEGCYLCISELLHRRLSY